MPPALIETFERQGIEMLHAWGMTEMSPLGTVAALKAKHLRLNSDARRAIKVKQARPTFGVELKNLDEAGHLRPHDGESMGELLVRGSSAAILMVPRLAPPQSRRTAGSVPATSRRSTQTGSFKSLIGAKMSSSPGTNGSARLIWRTPP